MDPHAQRSFVGVGGASRPHGDLLIRRTHPYFGRTRRDLPRYRLAERTHDVALVDDTGALLAKRHITDDAAGYTLLLELLAEHGDSEKDPIPVAIETSRGR